jgi:hypothetical protein
MNIDCRVHSARRRLSSMMTANQISTQGDWPFHIMRSGSRATPLQYIENTPEDTRNRPKCVTFQNVSTLAGRRGSYISACRFEVTCRSPPELA